MTRRRKSIKGKKLTANQLQKEVLKTLTRNPKKRFSAKQLIKKLKITNNKDAVNYALSKLAEDNKIRHVKEGKFRIAAGGYPTTVKPSTKIGVVDLIRTGAAYIVCEGEKDDIYVPARHLNTALNGDKVEIAVSQGRGRRKPEGKVTKIVERSREHFIGTLHLYKNLALVRPDGHYSDLEIRIDRENLNGAENREKVVVKIVEWPKRPNQFPMGAITSVLGKSGSNEIEMKSILINNGFELEFPAEVLSEANQLNDKISDEELAIRRDMREVPTFTIDPVDAKDFDDAISIQYLEDGLIELGVHIADVTHFVRPSTELDKFALKRSTSVYLVDRVLPMLPEKISNELCSLRPHEDKHTFSAVFTFDENRKKVNQWFGKTFTHSDHRFTYEDAQEVLTNGKGKFAKELKTANQIAKKLRKNRFKNGAIDFDSEELRFKLDEEGKPIGLYIKERQDTNRMIEDLMLLANREVAGFIAKKGSEQEIPFVYRIHDSPDPEKVADFARFALEMGIKMDVSTPEKIAASFNKLGKAAEENEMLKMLQPLAIRTMAKAEYSPDNIGHYGLAFKNYAHFTSPIRRYADVLVHRILQMNLTDFYRTHKEKLDLKCKHISKQERNAMNAERESIKVKQVEYISQFIGEDFDGHIAGMIDRGLFIELDENKVEGMVGFEQLDEAFEISSGRLKAVGRRTGTTFKIGDPIRVRILEANLETRRIEMEYIPPKG